MDYKAPENIYWLFSSTAQSVSAFIALLITGFAFVQTIMDGLQQKDETLEEIHNKLKKEYYTKITILSIVTGLAIILSLLVVFLNEYTFRFKTLLLLFTALLNIIAIGGGIMFVISIINPDRYKNAAEKIIKEDKTEFSQTGNAVDQMTFSELIEKLPSVHFIRIHQSNIVNIAHIQKIENNHVYISTYKVPISNRYKDILFDRLDLK